MDNLTHTLVGLTAAKAGLERLSPGATVVCVIAANAPDADILAVFGGSWFYLKHHRGITHSIVGTLVLALLLPLAFYVAVHLIARLRGRVPQARLKGLVIASLIASASHPLMDWTNNYGVRPFLPWDARWFYGDLVYIVDPWLWLTLGGGTFLLTATTRWRTVAWALLATLATFAFIVLPLRAGLDFPFVTRALWLAGLAVLLLAHRKKLASRRGSSVALAALAFAVLYWGALGLLHRRALVESQARAASLSQQHHENLLRLAATPTLADPFRWRAIAETDSAFYRFDTTFWSGVEAQRLNPSQLLRFEKPQGGDAAAARRAAQDERAQIFLGFSRFPAGGAGQPRALNKHRAFSPSTSPRVS